MSVVFVVKKPQAYLIFTYFMFLHIKIMIERTILLSEILQQKYRIRYQTWPKLINNVSPLWDNITNSNNMQVHVTELVGGTTYYQFFKSCPLWFRVSFPGHSIDRLTIESPTTRSNSIDKVTCQWTLIPKDDSNCRKCVNCNGLFVIYRRPPQNSSDWFIYVTLTLSHSIPLIRWTDSPIRFT
jgi:hypothetical protein